jgi:AraC family transcriptional regulator, transcriptional activator of pobA
MAKSTVYGISDFGKIDTNLFYANRLNAHVKEHRFTELPHKHNFYLVILVTKGSGRHEIDFRNYQVGPGSVFLMQPGQMHWWKLSNDIDGFVFFHSRDFFEEGYTRSVINQFPFFQSFQNLPYLKINKTRIPVLTPLFSEMVKDYRSPETIYKNQKLHALLNLVYIAIAGLYPVDEHKSSRYLETFADFEALIKNNFREHRLPNYYASALNITEKHLNRICRDCVDKTSTQLIAERVLLEAKRLLIQSKQNITEIGDELSFSDTSYFVRFFKKHEGETPLTFQKKYLR